MTLKRSGKPMRVQLQRTKGWRKPSGVVTIARPSKWGNPYVVHPGAGLSCDQHEDLCVTDPEVAVRRFRYAILWPLTGQPPVPTSDDIRRELRGKDLACWCPLDRPCHGDVLLELANE